MINTTGPSLASLYTFTTALEEIARLTAENERLRNALRDLLEDTQHAKHNCGDEDCPVANARALLEGRA